MAFTTNKTISAVLCSLALSACGGTFNFNQNQTEALISLNDSDQVKQTIVDLINAVDSKQWQQAQNEMTPNVLTDYSSLFGQPRSEVTRAELVGGWQNLLQNASTHHILSNFDISIEGNNATAYSHVYASHVANGIDYWDVYGRYEHKLIKQQNDWRISSMTLLTHGQKGNLNFVQQALEQNEKLAAMVKKEKVNFVSDGENVVGNIYYPANYDPSKVYPAVVVSGSWTTVKEQMGGLYAERLAQKGFVTLAFDFRNFGESEGTPRFHENPDKKVIDIKNAVTFLQNQSSIDEHKIGALGICAGSMYTLMAAADDKRIKSVVTAASWLHDAEAVKLFYGGEEGVNAKLAQAKAAKNTYQTTGEVEYIPSISTTDETAAMYGPYDYYLNPERGAVAQWSADKFAVMTWEDWLTLDPMPSAEKLTSPTLMIHSDGAVLPQYTKKYFANIATNKKLLHWIETDMPSPYHQFNFYDQDAEVNESISVAADWFVNNL